MWISIPKFIFRYLASTWKWASDIYLHIFSVFRCFRLRARRPAVRSSASAPNDASVTPARLPPPQHAGGNSFTTADQGGGGTSRVASSQNGDQRGAPREAGGDRGVGGPQGGGSGSGGGGGGGVSGGSVPGLTSRCVSVCDGGVYPSARLAWFNPSFARVGGLSSRRH